MTQPAPRSTAQIHAHQRGKAGGRLRRGARRRGALRSGAGRWGARRSGARRRAPSSSAAGRSVLLSARRRELRVLLCSGWGPRKTDDTEPRASVCFTSEGCGMDNGIARG
ncbi:hypothetical protein PVAP13_9NG105773 [Panicum virgatum]|uniref:Uncharacterized protein n=1 Tax=Panicum virgatum TaxID=38727 RepID=A0A8T0MDI5_PANVG|nr:hypothetical protein PVAP13_9NG105773 [Panicum virgatum]